MCPPSLLPPDHRTGEGGRRVAGELIRALWATAAAGTEGEMRREVWGPDPRPQLSQRQPEVRSGTTPVHPPLPAPPLRSHPRAPGRRDLAPPTPIPFLCFGRKEGGRGEGFLPKSPSPSLYLVKKPPTFCLFAKKTLPFTFFKNKPSP